jgi:S1-C subfamily serine protease
MLLAMRTIQAAAVFVVISALASGCGITKFREPTREEILQRILPSAVQIVVEQQEGHRVRASSGVVLAARNTEHGASCFIVTAGHAVSGIVGRKEVYVVLGRYRGDGRRVAATVLAYRDTPEFDIALLKTEETSCVPAFVGRAPALGESVWVVGFPWGRHMALASGIVSQINANAGAEQDTASRLMVDASVSYGTSGGGVYDGRDGGLIGLVEGYSTARVSSQGAKPSWYIDVPVPGQTFVTPMSDLRRFLAESGYPDLVGPPDRRSHPGPVVRDR